MDIRANGSKLAGQSPDSVEVLIALLSVEPLDPRFETCGNFVSNAEPLAPWPNVHIFGNFWAISHCFDIIGTPEECKALVAAISENQKSDAYKAARRELRNADLVARK